MTDLYEIVAKYRSPRQPADRGVTVAIVGVGLKKMIVVGRYNQTLLIDYGRLEWMEDNSGIVGIAIGG